MTESVEVAADNEMKLEVAAVVNVESAENVAPPFEFVKLRGYDTRSKLSSLESVTECWVTKVISTVCWPYNSSIHTARPRSTADRSPIDHGGSRQETEDMKILRKRLAAIR